MAREPIPAGEKGTSAVKTVSVKKASVKKEVKKEAGNRPPTEEDLASVFRKIISHGA